ncbi:DNA-directed RNA polymerase III subunit RPC5 [Trichinella zimbabwensis]|uniref:DNA-directed RNA polymerase III subunit RPC5 n=1 Tax=Trichinella zimbabwensis TaxID=268475 RepID=A0A0V1H5S6_9BILA|nr:DNA-directed RNA polymerase III subunit RPC5 [Trichinella zimbabwensis]
MSEDDDPVIKEIDVYLKKDDSNLLYLLQLPNCHYLENMKPTAFNFSPSSEQIELLMSANDVSQLNFDVAPGSSLRHTRIKSEYFLQTGCAVNPSSMNNLAVGYPTEDAFHLSMLKGTAWMQLSQCEQSEVILSKEGTSSIRDSFEDSYSEDEELEIPSPTPTAPSNEKRKSKSVLEAVRVRFENVNTSGSSNSTKPMHQNVSRNVERIPTKGWHLLKVNQNLSIDEKLALLTLDKTIAEESWKMKQELFDEDFNFWGKFFENEIVDGSVPIKVEETRKPLPELVFTLLKSGMVVRFFDLLNQLPYDVNFDEVLSLLDEYALLVQGCWVLKSEFSIEEGFEDARTDIQRTLLLVARDFLLYKFTKNRVVLLRELERMLPIEEHIWRYFLMEIARMVPRLGWQFVHPKDISFLHSFPKVAQKQEEIWKNKYVHLVKVIADYENERTNKKATVAGTSRKVKSGKSASSDSSCKGSAVVKSSPTPARPEPKVKKQPSRNSDKNAMGGGNVVILKVEPGTENATANDHFHLLDGKRKQKVVVIDKSQNDLQAELCSMFQRKRVYSLDFITSRVISRFPAVCDEMIEKCSEAIGAIRIEGGKMDKVFYGFIGIDTCRELRRQIINLLRDKGRFRFKTFKQACLDKGLTTQTDEQLKSLLKEYCDSKYGVYYLMET